MKRLSRNMSALVAGAGLLAAGAPASAEPEGCLLVTADELWTMAPGSTGPIEHGAVLIEDGVIRVVGPAGEVVAPAGCRRLDAAVVTPGLIDARATVGLTGIYNDEHDQDQLESSAPIQPELRAIDAYNAQEQLVAHVRSFGVTTVHTGHGPGELVTGGTLLVKLRGDTVEEALIRPAVAVAATLGPAGHRSGASSPGTRGKAVAMLRAELIKAREFLDKQGATEGDRDGDSGAPPAARDLRTEALAGVLRGESALLVRANRAQDIATALRLEDEFGIELWLAGAAEAYLLVEEIKAAGVPVIIHPAKKRAWGDYQNASFTTAATLADAGIPVVFQSGYEAYVPKVRVVLLEAALNAARGMGKERALRALTIDAAELLDVADRVGSLEVGKDADVAMYSGDPFEYLTHCTGVVIDGEVMFLGER